jgi:iron complex transport system permease protein
LLQSTSSLADPDSRANVSRAVSRSHGRLLLVLVGALLAMLIFDVSMAPKGIVSDKIPPSLVVRVIARHAPVLGKYIQPPSGTPIFVNTVDSIVWSQRLPKALGGVLIGMMLAMAGVAFQSLLMNPLADPYTTGVASGSALGAIALGAASSAAAAWMGGFAQIGAAFASGLLAVSIVYMLARVGGRVSAQTFLLSGTIVGSFFFSLVPLLLSWSNDKSLDQRNLILSSLFGSLIRMDWTKCGLLLPFCALGFLLLWVGAAELDMMALGEESAAHLGVDTEAFKRRVILIGSLMTAAAVAVAGIIAFVGFLVPHLARRLVGSNHRDLVPASALLGGFVVVLAEYLSRVWLHDLEIGIITSLLGVPFFCALMRRRMVR